MKVLILTTDTPHHIKFIEEIRKSFDNLTVFIETKSRALNHYKTKHKLDTDQENYEKNIWFKNKNLSIDDFVQTSKFENLNDDYSIKQMQSKNYDVVIVFGTGMLSKKFINSAPKHIYNLHGGDPENYRGLDTHLWAIFHRDFNNLYTTLHRVDESLDTGSIVFKKRLNLNNISDLYKLRAFNTDICCELVKNLLNKINRNDLINYQKQKQTGRYYSAMPSALKSDCIKKFNIYKKK